jgi:hypothetical protein
VRGCYRLNAKKNNIKSERHKMVDVNKDGSMSAVVGGVETALTSPSFRPLVVDGQQRPVGEYTLACNGKLDHFEIASLFPDCIVRDFWGTSYGSYLVRLVPDPGLQETRHRALALAKIVGIRASY